MASIRIGTCGYSYFDPGEDWQDVYDSKLQAYADHFDVVELNRTFYELPQVSTAERWRREVADDFEFVVKAWQALTHPIESPTWRDRDALTATQREEVGYLRPNETVLDAWRATRERAEALEADVCLVQTPPSFDCDPAHEANLRSFFGSIDRGGLEIAWEPRGDWHDHPDRLGALCTELDLVHVVDPFRHEPRDERPTAYARLHGLNDDPYDYDYEYADDELRDLADVLGDYATSNAAVYCLFNNFGMYEDARRLADVL